MVAVAMPLQAQAGFFSSAFGGPAYAAVGTDTSAIDSSQNSQTLALLQANISSSSILGSNSKPSTSTTASSLDPNSNVNILSDNAILPTTGPLGVASDLADAIDSSTDQPSVYVIRAGDSVAQIAQMFGVTSDTILWANNMKKGDALHAGDVLFILPVSGLELTVTKGQTLQSIAKLYKADPSDIAQYNGISEDAPLAIGDQLIIPDGVKSVEGDKPVTDLKASIAKDNKYYEQHPIKNFAGYYVDPVPGYRLSQGIHDNNAVDLAIAPGTPIHAAAAGTVLLARNGYNGGFGNVVIINHPNGTQTLYAHQSKLASYAGEHVDQGQIIGYVGSTGHSTGPHLHFEVHGARNPGADGSWSN